MNGVAHCPSADDSTPVTIAILGGVTVIDRADLPVLLLHRWRVSTSGYASRSVRDAGSKRILYLHRAITAAPAGREVDHANGDKLDNRRANLRVCTASENQRNKRKPAEFRGAPVSSPYKGVWWSESNRGWCAMIRVNRKRIYLGTFASDIEAAAAYDRVAEREFGAFARLNLLVRVSA